MPTLVQLRRFVVLAEELHFRNAAKRLHLAQPALSRSIQELEAEIGIPLLDRTSRIVSLTPAGRIFVEECRATISRVHLSVRRARDAALGDAGLIVVGYTDIIMLSILPKLIGRFRIEHPEIQLELRSMSTPDQKAGLKDGSIDVGFFTGPFKHQSFSAVVMKREPFVALVSEDHPLAGMDAISVRDLAEEPFVLGFRDWWQPFRSIVDNICVQNGFSAEVVQEAFNSIGVFGLVAANVGVTLYPYCDGALFHSNVVARRLSRCAALHETVMAWDAANVSAALARFVKFLAAEQKALARKR